MTNIYAIFHDGTKQKTPYLAGSKDEYKFHAVGISSGSIHDSPNKYFFVSEDAYKAWCGEKEEGALEERGKRKAAPRDRPMRLIPGLYTIGDPTPAPRTVGDEDDTDYDDMPELEIDS